MSSEIRDGERFNWLGECFFNSCEKLLKFLGYNILYSKKSSKDFIVEHSENKSFCLRGKLLVEVSTAFLKDAEIEEIVEKMKVEKIKNGLWITNSKMNDDFIKQANEKGVYVWDIRTLYLITALHHLQSIWCSGTKVSKIVGDGLEIIRSIERDKKELFINAIILSTNPLKDLMVVDIQKSINLLFEDIKNSGINPIDVNIIILSNGVINKAVYSELDKILERYNHEFSKDIIYGQVLEIFDFYTAPFNYNLLFLD